MQRSGGVEVERCRGAEVQRCRGAEVERCRGKEEDLCRECAGAEMQQWCKCAEVVLVQRC